MRCYGSRVVLGRRRFRCFRRGSSLWCLRGICRVRLFLIAPLSVVASLLAITRSSEIPTTQKCLVQVDFPPANRTFHVIKGEQKRIRSKSRHGTRLIKWPSDRLEDRRLLKKQRLLEKLRVRVRLYDAYSVIQRVIDRCWSSRVPQNHSLAIKVARRRPPTWLTVATTTNNRV